VRFATLPGPVGIALSIFM